MLTPVNNENSNTLNISMNDSRKLETKKSASNKPMTPKRSMKQLTKLLLIKDDSEEEIETTSFDSDFPRCSSHQRRVGYFCPTCLTYSFCDKCSVSHNHPTIEYSTIEKCMVNNMRLLQEKMQKLESLRQHVSESHIELQVLAHRTMQSRRHLFDRVRKFIDEMEKMAELQLNSMLTRKRTEIMNTQKLLKQFIDAEDPLRFLVEQPKEDTLWEPINLQDVEEKCDKLLDKLRSFCHGLKSPLIREVNITLDEQPRVSSCQKQNTIVKSRRDHTPALEKCILQNILNNQKKSSTGFMKTMSLMKETPGLSLEGVPKSRLNRGNFFQ